MASYSAQNVGAIASAPADAVPQLFRRREEGFTLVEVIWALMLIGLIAMGSLALFLHGIKTVAHLQRQQAAVSLASSAMDAARSVSGAAVNSVGTSGLVKGRSQSAVETVWTEATSRDSSDTADMGMEYDPQNGLTAADQWVPVRSTATVSNQTYTIDTLVGSCYRLRAASTVSQNCVASNPAPASDTYVKLYRVRVVVSWDEGEAASGAHTYKVSSLVDPSEDATWNTAIKPFAYDDEFNVSAGGSPTFHAIVLNDSVEYNTTGTESPVRIISQPAHGSVSVNVAQGLNGVVFTPPSDSSRSGTVTFTYKVEGSSGEESPEAATVTVHILPTPVADTGGDTIFVEPGSTTAINDLLIANDLGVTNYDSARTTTIVPVWSKTVDMFSTEEVSEATQDARAADRQNLASVGITTNSSGTVHYEAPDTDGHSETFYYYLVDDSTAPDGARYPSAEAAQVTITTRVLPLHTPNVTVDLDATTENQVWHSIDWRDLTGNAPGTLIRTHTIAPANNNGLVQYDGNGGLGIGSTLDFRTLPDTVGTYQITYSVISPGGKDSADTGDIGTITVNVLPLANAPSTNPTVRRNQTVDINLVARAVPSTNVEVVDLGTASCGSVQILGNGQVRFTASSIASNTVPRDCTFTFRLRTTDTVPLLKSATVPPVAWAPATRVTVRVTN